jgi:hypothetical protein
VRTRPTLVSMTLLFLGVLLAGASLALGDGHLLKKAFLHLHIDLEGFPLHLWLRILRALRWGATAAGLACVLASVCSNRMSAPLFRPQTEHGPNHPDPFAVLALFCLCSVAYLLAGRFCFQGYPLTPDEFAYLYQARLLAHATVSAPCHPLQEFFTAAFIAHHNCRVFSIMPMGWSLVLAPATLLGVPWVVSPLCTALAVALTYSVGSSVYSPRTGLLAAALMAVCPFVAGNSGTYLPHQATLVCFLSFLALFVRAEQGKAGWRHYCLIGLAMAAVASIHELDVSLCAPFLLVWVYRIFRAEHRRQRGLIVLSICLFLATAAAFALWRNWKLTGSPLHVPFEAYVDDENFLSINFVRTPPIGIYSLEMLRERCAWTLKRLALLNVWLFPCAPVFLFMAPCLASKKRRWDVLLLSSMASLWAAYMLYNSWGGIQFGPRYYLPAAGTASLLIAETLLRLGANSRGRYRGALRLFVGLSFASLIGCSAAFLRFLPEVVHYARTIQDVGALLTEKNIHHSIIFLGLTRADAAADPTRIYLRIRNTPDLSDDNLVAVDRGDDNKRLMEFYPERRYFKCVISIDRLLEGEEMEMTEIPPGPSGSKSEERDPLRRSRL